MKQAVPPLRWHGGKNAFSGKLAKWLVRLMDVDHTRFVDAYCGGLSVLLYKPCEGISEFANDTNLELSNFWEVLASTTHFPEFQRRVEATPFSSVAFERAAIKNEGDAVGRAVNFFVRCRQSRQGLLRDFATPTGRERRGMNEQVSSWLSSIEGLEDVHCRLKRVEVRCQSALSLIDELDSESTLFYLDPPYLHSTRSTTKEYREHEMTESDHVALLTRLVSIKGKFVLSGYRSLLYDSAEKAAGWSSHEFRLPNNASSSKTKEVKTEVAWTNFRLKD